MEFISSCAAGLEDLVAGEISSWNGQITSSGRGAVRWSGPLEAGYRACLWSRFSARVILILAEFSIADSDELYDAARSIIWEEHLAVNGSFAVDCVLSGKGPISNSMFGSLRVKDGIVDRFRQETGKRPDVQVQRPDVRVHLNLAAGRAQIGIDLSGESLHRRGYRLEGGPAPLKESLAAAIIAMSGWDGSTLLLDPMCGSATLLIEAALMHSDSAPGLGRSYFGLLGWRGHRLELWESLVAEAIEREDAGQEKVWPQLIGYDGDRSAAKAARKNIKNAGLEHRIIIKHQEIQRLDNSFKQPGTLVCNPPYGERLTDKGSVKNLYRFLGNRLQHAFSDWRIALFTGAPDYADQLRLSCETTSRIFNGPLPCRLLTGTPSPRSSADAGFFFQIGKRLEPQNSTELSNRLSKNFKRLQPWARENDFDSFRLYDRDLPQFNVSIDIIGSSIYIDEFPPPSSIDATLADERFNQVTAALRSLFEVGRDRLIVRRRHRKTSKGKKGEIRSRSCESREGEAFFVIDLPGDVVEGLCPDQRFVRRYIRENVGTGLFLSLFDVSGTGAVCAALGGAQATTSLGLSAKEMVSIRINYSRNGMAFSNHQLLGDDPAVWLRKNRQPYDLIHINLRHNLSYHRKSQRFQAPAEDPSLIDLAVASLAPGGRVILSTLIPSFSLDPVLKKKFSCRDISRKMAVLDVKRSVPGFQCHLIERRNDGERTRLL